MDKTHTHTRQLGAMGREWEEGKTLPIIPGKSVHNHTNIPIYPKVALISYATKSFPRTQYFICSFTKVKKTF